MIRGFALLGILTANMAFFASPVLYTGMSGAMLWSGTLNQAAMLLIDSFALGKFFTMFSLLFGLGFFLFLQRAEQKTNRPGWLFLRRLFILFLFGLIHAFGIWYGDILLVYALTGPLLLLFYQRKPKTVLRWAFSVLLVLPILMSLLVGLLWLSGEANNLPADTQAIIDKEAITQSQAAYGSGSFTEIMEQRWTDYAFAFGNYLFIVPVILAMFLFGVYAAKTKRYQNFSHQLPFYKKLMIGSLIIGLPFNALSVYGSYQEDLIFYMISFVGLMIGGPALCLFYIASMILLSQKPRWARWFQPLRAVGRTALSNYLLQSLVCTTIFYSYGFGMYGKIGPAGWLVIVAALFSAQIVLSNIWLKHFRFGPAEWLWRSLTYGKRQPFKQPKHLS